MQSTRSKPTPYSIEILTTDESAVRVSQCWLEANRALSAYRSTDNDKDRFAYWEIAQLHMSRAAYCHVYDLQDARDAVRLMIAEIELNMEVEDETSDDLRRLGLLSGVRQFLQNQINKQIDGETGKPERP